MAAVGRRWRMLRKTAVAHLQLVGPLPQPRVRVMCHGAVWLVADQQLEHHLARKFGSLAGRLDLHARGRLADAGGGEHPLSLDLDHADPAIAVGAIAGLRQPTEMWDLDALPVGDLPDRFILLSRDFRAVEEEGDGFGHREIPGENVVPAKAGTHFSIGSEAARWIPAGACPRAGRRLDPWAGMAIRVFCADRRITSGPHENASAPA